MKTLFINRHAKSSWNDLSLADFDRPLNNRGKVNATFLAELFAKEENVDLLISSPAKRALSTAQSFAKALNRSTDEIILEPIVYGASVQEMIELINGIDDKYSSAMIFGHNPTLSSLTSYLDESFFTDLVTCARVQIEFEIGTWAELSGGIGSVVHHVYPRMYPEMAHL